LGLRFAVLLIVTSWFAGSATAGFEANGLAACMLVVKCSRKLDLRIVLI
jgi:hypothetical protein